MTLPTRIPVLPAPARRPAATAAVILASSMSVDSSSARRLRARKVARAGLRQAIRRSPGKLGWVISARLAWSNSDICSGPSSAARAAIAGARSAVTQPNPPRSRSASTRALVIIPRSPTITMSLRANVSLTACTMVVNAVRVLAGDTADPTAFTTIVQAVADTFALNDMVMVGDRGMITSARVEALRDLGGFGWVTALRAPAIAALAADDGPLQMSLFDQANLAEITHPHYPAERLVACRNPALATERARKRLALLEATDTELTKITAAVDAGRLAGAGKIGIRVGKVIGRYKMAKHYTLIHI